MVTITRLTASTALALVALPSQAALLSYQAAVGPEVAGATGSGSVVLHYDSIAHTLQILSTWSGLTGTTTVAHIHCCVASPGTGVAGVAVAPGTVPGFPSGTTAGAYTSPLIDLTNAASFTAAFLNGFGGGTLAGAEAALVSGLNNGTAYFNIHTNAFPAGEIRGFPAAVPEPGMLVLSALGLATLGWSRRRHV